MEKDIADLAQLVAFHLLAENGYVEYASYIPIEVMRKLRDEGRCDLYTYSWKTGPGVAELRWYALEKK